MKPNYLKTLLLTWLRVLFLIGLLTFVACVALTATWLVVKVGILLWGAL